MGTHQFCVSLQVVRRVRLCGVLCFALNALPLAPLCTLLHVGRVSCSCESCGSCFPDVSCPPLGKVVQYVAFLAVTCTRNADTPPN